MKTFNPFPVQIMQIIVAAGITGVVLSLLWLVLTLPVSSVVQAFEANGVLSSDANGVTEFINLFVGVFGILVCLSIIAWGWKKAVEEREYGFALPD